MSDFRKLGTKLAIIFNIWLSLQESRKSDTMRISTLTRQPVTIANYRLTAR
jgi:hypothetical protein